MSLAINDTTMISDQNPHTARLARGRPSRWDVSWLPGQTLDRNTAITAMILADTTASQDLHEGHRLWPHIQGWAEELGLTAPDAIRRASEPPEKTSSQEPSNRAPGPEDYRPLFNGQPVMEDGSGRLVHGCEPHAEDGSSASVPEPEAGQ